MIVLGAAETDWVSVVMQGGAVAILGYLAIHGLPKLLNEMKVLHANEVEGRDKERAQHREDLSSAFTMFKEESRLNRAQAKEESALERTLCREQHKEIVAAVGHSQEVIVSEMTKQLVASHGFASQALHEVKEAATSTPKVSPGDSGIHK